MKKLLLLLFLFLSLPIQAQPTSCNGEAGIQGRSDILWCEQWESSTWWQTSGYLKIASTTNPVAPVAADVSKASIVSTGCISGNCVKIDFPVGECCGITIHRTIPGTQQEAWARYYIKFASNWSPDLTGGGSGGKMPGFADVDAFPDSQCGNGGAFSDGINCWSARGSFRNCTSSTSQDGPAGSDICTADLDGKQATTRMGYYFYIPGGNANETNQAFGFWDTLATGSASFGTDNCLTNPQSLGNWGTNKCGIGAGGFVNDRWYRVEQHIKMNTPGQSNGVAEAWVDGVLKWRKTNMVFRNVGHDNLHVRTFWLDTFFGGEFVGPTAATSLYLDQLVVSNKGRIGAFKSSGNFASNTFSVTVNNPSSNGGACNSTGGATYLEAAANGIIPGDYCVLSMTGMNFSLIQAPDGGGNVLEFANKGVYDAVNKEIRYVGTEDTTPTTANIGVKHLKYVLSTNTWSSTTTPYGDDQSHTWDVNAIDPATGCSYVIKPRSTEAYRWCGSSWASLPTNSAFSGEIPACTWDSTRGGLLCWGERNTGLQLWTPGSGNSLPGSWSTIVAGSSCTGQCTDFAIAYAANTSWVYLSGGTNAPTTYRRYSPTGTMTTHSSPSSIALKCCGSGGRLTAYDYRTGKVVVADPFGQRIWQLDVAANTWTDKGAVGPPLNESFTGNVHGIVVPISDFGGVLMYVMYRGTSSAPSAYLYKHN